MGLYLDHTNMQTLEHHMKTLITYTLIVVAGIWLALKGADLLTETAQAKMDAHHAQIDRHTF